ncbi:MAG: YhjD/YihY/BrkB family envelope integrity protein [Ghiorsea sp.]
MLNPWRVFIKTNQHFQGFHGMQFAAALSYSTLLAVVPMTALLFFLSLQTELFSTMFEQVREQVLLQLLPTSRDYVETYLLQTSQNIKSFSYLGMLIVFVSAIWLSLGIERAFNHIWQVTTPRKLLLRIPAHIIIWLFTPMLIMVSITATTWLISLPYLDDIGLQASKLSYIAPWLISAIALFLLYDFVPNTKVRFWSALWAAAFAGFLFELSKWAFTIYITQVAMYEKLYGALAALPIFMIWVLISWAIILWGASLCVTIQQE